MLLRLSRTPQANISSHYWSCLATPPRAVTRQCMSRIVPAGHSCPGVCSVRTITHDIHRTDEQDPRFLDPEFINRRLNRLALSIPCISNDNSPDYEAAWTIGEHPATIAQAIWTIVPAQSRLKDYLRVDVYRERHLDSIHRAFGLQRVTHDKIDYADLVQAQFDEEKANVMHIRAMYDPATIRAHFEASRAIRDKLQQDTAVAYDPYAEPVTDSDLEELKNQQAIEEIEHKGPYRGPRKDLHVTMITQMVEKLVDDLMMQAVNERFGGDPEAIRLAVESLDGPWTALGMLRSEGYPQYESTHANPAAAVDAIKRANDTLRLLFAQWEKAKQQEKGPNVKGGSPLATNILYKICFNLLVQSYQPDIHTYNTLILGLTAVGEHRLARVVVESLNKSRFAPTKMTIIILLQHYFASNDILDFYRYIRRMIGKDSRGVGRRRINWSSAEQEGASWDQWAREHNATEHLEWLIQPSWLDAGEMDMLLKGLIHFGQGQHAARILSIALKQGYEVPTSTLVDLLAMVASRLDHDAASLLVRVLCANSHDLTALLLADDQGACPQGLVPQLRRVLDMYSVHLAWEMGTRKHDWWRPPADQQEAEERRELERQNGSVAKRLREENPRRMLPRDMGLPGLKDIGMALWIKEISLYLDQVSAALAQLSLKLERESRYWGAGKGIRKSYVVSKFNAWRHQRGPDRDGASFPTELPVSQWRHAMGLRVRRRRMLRFHMVAEQVELLTVAIANCYSDFLQLSTIPVAIRNKAIATNDALSARSQYLFTFELYNGDWVEAAAATRASNAHMYPSANRGQWTEELRKALVVECELAVRACAQLSRETKCALAEYRAPGSGDALLSKYGSWSKVPLDVIESLENPDGPADQPVGGTGTLPEPAWLGPPATGFWSPIVASPRWKNT